MHLNSTIKSSFFDEINYWTWGDFENNTDMEVTVTPKKLPRVFVKYTQWSKIRSTLNLTWYAELWGGAYPCSKRQCVRYVCPILNLWIIIISSRRDKRNKLITFTLGSITCNLFWVSGNTYPMNGNTYPINGQKSSNYFSFEVDVSTLFNKQHCDVDVTIVSSDVKWCEITLKVRSSTQQLQFCLARTNTDKQ